MPVGVFLTHGHTGHAQIAPMEGGRINIQYRRVECTPPEPLKVNIHANVGVGGWLRIAVEVSIATDLLCERPTHATRAKPMQPVLRYVSRRCGGAMSAHGMMCCGAPWPDVLAPGPSKPLRHAHGVLHYPIGRAACGGLRRHLVGADEGR